MENVSNELIFEEYKEKAAELYIKSIENLGMAYFSLISDLEVLSFDKSRMTSFKNISKAARMLRYDFSDEPTRSIYYFHSCVIALEIGLTDEAITLFSEMKENKSEDNIFTDSVEKLFLKRNIPV